jgi:hypothetical protein
MKRLVFAFIAVFTLALPAAAQDAALTYDPSVCAAFTDGGALSPECEAMIAAFPVPPNITPIQQDAYTLSYYSFWKVGPGTTPEYDAPGGSIVGEIPAGYNYIRALDLSVDGWIQFEGGRWVPRNLATAAQPSYFRGMMIDGGLDHWFGFVLDLSRIFVSAYPGGPRSQENGRWIERYEPVPIFSVATDADGWEWYMIGPNQWVEQRFLAVVKPIARPEGVTGRWVAVDLYEQTLVAYEDDMPVFATLVSSGLERTETNEGLFSVWARLPRDRMAGATGAPNAYALQSVPWVMYFDGSIALHGAYWHDYFGYRQSRGCVNMTISDARWLFEWLEAETPGPDGSINSEVLVYSSGEYGVTASGL